VSVIPPPTPESGRDIPLDQSCFLSIDSPPSFLLRGSGASFGPLCASISLSSLLAEETRGHAELTPVVLYFAAVWGEWPTHRKRQWQKFLPSLPYQRHETRRVLRDGARSRMQENSQDDPYNSCLFLGMNFGANFLNRPAHLQSFSLDPQGYLKPSVNRLFHFLSSLSFK